MVKMPSHEFQRICRDMSQLGDSIVVACTKVMATPTHYKTKHDGFYQFCCIFCYILNSKLCSF